MADERSASCALWTTLLAAALAIVGPLSACRRPAAPTEDTTAAATPNVLLISIDTLRPDHLGCYGYSRATSPCLDQVAAQGVLFENHISSTSWTLPAHAALFTGLPDSVHGCTDTDQRLPDNIPTLAEQFAHAGYQTAGFFSGPYLHPAFGLGRGFTHFEDCTAYADLIAATPATRWAMDVAIMRRSHEDITSPRVFAAFKRWWDEHRESRFFVFVHLWDPHFDFIPPPPFDTRFDPGYTGPITGRDFFFDARINADMSPRDLQHLIALYDGEIAWTDEHVGKILNELKQAGVLDHTIVAITSDHGTEFFEHHDKAHRKTLFDEVIRTPLLLRYPGRLPAGTRVHAQTRLIDVAPTLLALAGVPAAWRPMGQSLADLARDPARPFEPVAVSELFSVGRQMRTIRTLEWKFTDLLATRKRFYVDLTSDPGERQLLTGLSQDRGRELQLRYAATVELLDSWRAAVGAASQPSVIPDDVRKKLESLGYVGGAETQPARDPQPSDEP